VDFRQLPAMLAEIDIGIVPRVPGPFNEGQSFSSGLEYAAAGCPFVAYPSGEYRLLNEQGAGLVAGSVDEWRDQLDLLLRAPAVRDTWRQMGRAVVAEKHGPKRIGIQYHQLFEQLLEARRAA
jgi:glycosyltransferase involved in cell wall biosynthesis